MTEANGEFKGSTNTRLEHIEGDLRDIKSDVRLLKERQDRWLGVIAAGAFALPIVLRVLFP